MLIFANHFSPRLLFILSSIFLFVWNPLHAYYIVTEETGSIFYLNHTQQNKQSNIEKLKSKIGFVKEDEGKFKILYELNEEKEYIIRKTVVNLGTKEVIPDNLPR